MSELSGKQANRFGKKMLEIDKDLPRPICPYCNNQMKWNGAHICKTKLITLTKPDLSKLLWNFFIKGKENLPEYKAREEIKLIVEKLE